MNSELIVFTLNGCSHCVNLKDLLTKLEIPYTEIEIGTNRKLWDQVVEQTGHNVLPTVFIKNKNTEVGPVFIPGKDFHSSEELIPKISQHL
jgi:glutaredoxin